MLRKAAAITGSAVFLVIAPGFVAGLVPWWISRWRLEPGFLRLTVLRLAGGLLLFLGVIGLLDSFARFAVQGLWARRRRFSRLAIWLSPGYVVMFEIRCTWQS